VKPTLCIDRQLVLCTDDDDDDDDYDEDLLDLDASALDFLRNLDTQVNGSLRCNDNDLETVTGERVLLCVFTV